MERSLELIERRHSILCFLNMDCYDRKVRENGIVFHKFEDVLSVTTTEYKMWTRLKVVSSFSYDGPGCQMNIHHSNPSRM